MAAPAGGVGGGRLWCGRPRRPPLLLLRRNILNSLNSPGSLQTPLPLLAWLSHTSRRPPLGNDGFHLLHPGPLTPACCTAVTPTSPHPRNNLFLPLGRPLSLASSCPLRISRFLSAEELLVFLCSLRVMWKNPTCPLPRHSTQATARHWEDQPGEAGATRKPDRERTIHAPGPTVSLQGPPCSACSHIPETRDTCAAPTVLSPQGSDFSKMQTESGTFLLRIFQGFLRSGFSFKLLTHLRSHIRPAAIPSLTPTQPMPRRELYSSKMPRPSARGPLPGSGPRPAV